MVKILTKKKATEVSANALLVRRIFEKFFTFIDISNLNYILKHVKLKQAVFSQDICDSRITSNGVFKLMPR